MGGSEWKKNMFLVFFSLNSNIPRYVSCLENINFMLKNNHFICSHDIKFKYKNVFIKYPYDALFNHVRQKGFFMYIQIDEIKSQIKRNIYCIINVRRCISDSKAKLNMSNIMWYFIAIWRDKVSLLMDPRLKCGSVHAT